MRILIVDDDYISRLKLKSLLSEYGDCDAVPNGELSLKMFKIAHDESFPYGLITMDIDMPKMWGQEVVKKIREWENTHKEYLAEKHVKILMITVMKDIKDALTSFKEGCTGYMTKPVTPESIEKALKKIEISKL